MYTYIYNIQKIYTVIFSTDINCLVFFTFTLVADFWSPAFRIGKLVVLTQQVVRRLNRHGIRKKLQDSYGRCSMIHLNYSSEKSNVSLQPLNVSAILVFLSRTQIGKPTFKFKQLMPSLWIHPAFRFNAYSFWSYHCPPWSPSKV